MVASLSCTGCLHKKTTELYGIKMKMKYSFPAIFIMVILLVTGTGWAADNWEQYQALRQHLFLPATQNFQSITCRLKSAAYDEYTQDIDNELRREFGQGRYYFDSGAGSLKVTFSASSERLWFEVPAATVKPEGLLSPTDLQSLRNELQKAVEISQDFLTDMFKDLRIPKQERFLNLSVTPLRDKVMVSYQDASDGQEVKEYYQPDYHVIIQPISPRTLIWDFNYTRVMKDDSGQHKRVLTLIKNGEINQQGEVIRLYSSETVIEYAYISGILFPVHFMIILDGIRREARFEDCRVIR
jgi:hypothetical protein